MTKQYFQLQYHLLNRHIKDFGMRPFFGWFFGIVLFVAGSWVLYNKTNYAQFILLFIAINWLLQFNGQHRNNFLRFNFNKYNFLNIRTLENLIIALPFTIVFLLKQNYITAGTFLIFCFTLPHLRKGIELNKTIPTPFGKKPFELLIGFRKYYGAIAVCYCLVGIAIWVGNFNLGLVAFAASLLFSVSYYTKPEPVFFVWNYSTPASQFIMLKLKTAVQQLSMLSVIPFTGLLIAWPASWWLFMAVWALALLYIVLFILMKYAAYPNETNPPQLIIFAGCIGFPPLLIGMLPFFYSRSVNNLNTLLP